MCHRRVRLEACGLDRLRGVFNDRLADGRQLPQEGFEEFRLAGVLLELRDDVEDVDSRPEHSTEADRGVEGGP